MSKAMRTKRSRSSPWERIWRPAMAQAVGAAQTPEEALEAVRRLAGQCLAGARHPDADGPAGLVPALRKAKGNEGEETRLLRLARDAARARLAGKAE